MLSTCPDCLSSLKFNFYGFTATSFGFCQWKQAQSSGDKKVKTLSVPPRPVLQWTSLNSVDHPEVGARIKIRSGPGDEHSTPPHMNCNRFSADLRVLFFFFFFCQTATHEPCPTAPSMNNQMGHLYFHTRSLSRTINHANSTLSKVRT